MKRFKTAIVSLLLVCALGAYIWFFERKPKEDEGPKKEKVVYFVADDVKTVMIENPGAEKEEDRGPIVLKKNDKDVWSIAAPKQYEADQSEMRTLLATATDMNPDARVDSPGDLSQFGLSTPQAWLSFTLASGKSVTLFIGDKAINGQSYYVKVHNQASVFVVPLSSVDLLRKKVQDLRNKVLYATGFVEARKFVLKRPGRDPVVLEKKGDQWLLQEPGGRKSEADEEATRQFLNTVNGARAMDFIDRPNLAELGLGENNRGTIEIWPTDNGPSAVIVLGRKIKDKPRLYVRRKDQPHAIALLEYFDRETDKKWADFRNKGVMKFDATEATHLTVGKPGLALPYQKNPDGVWLSPGRDKANDEATGIVDALAACKVDSFADGVTPASAGTGKPLQTAKVTLKDGKSREFKFGRREGDKIYLASDKGPEIFLVLPQPANLIENALAPAAAFAFTPPAAP